jgi:hypothetical protein
MVSRMFLAYSIVNFEPIPFTKIASVLEGAKVQNNMDF